MQEKEKKFTTIRLFLIKNADPIQKEATRQHKVFLGKRKMRVEFIEKYQNGHIKAVQEIANHLQDTSLHAGVAFFEQFGEKQAKNAVQDGLSIEETIDGTIFLKQAIWKCLKNEGLLKDLSSEDMYHINQIIGTFIDVFDSKIAFTYHQERQYIENNLRFLAEASKILSSSLDYQTTLNTIAMLAVPQIADWCAVDILGADNQLLQVAVAHKDPKKVKWAKELRKKQPVDMNAPTGIPNILRTGKPEIYPVITDEMLVTIAKSKKELKLMRDLGFTSAMVVPIFSQKKAIGAITFVTTETRRNYNQADLLMAQELATRASVAIENARLYKGSQDAITMRDDFISVASHELKTPVTSVKMFTQVLKKHSEQIGDLKAVSHLSKMDKQINKLTELIYDLLNISKIQAGRMEFRKQLFDFDAQIKEIVEVLQQSSEKHKLVIQGETKKKIYGDEERIGQVINNLISNAVKYSPKANKVIIQLSSNKDCVTLSVTDFGIGMAKQHLDKIFERFYRVYDTTDKTFPGLGIGLYISSEIIKRHGGKFWVESNPGEGSTFSFSVPIKGREKENGKKSEKQSAKK
jgi:signal transduction histidine kinase